MANVKVARNTRDWDQSERWTDSSGKMRARIVAWADCKVQLERWLKKNPSRRVRFELPETYWLGRSCGWVKEPTP